MYKKVSINPNIKPSEEGNYSIDISPLTNTISFYFLPRHNHKLKIHKKRKSSCYQ